jgi:hypothetical protein
MFQIYNTDKPNYLVDGVEPTLGTTDRGPSLFTRGDVLGGGNLDISGSAYVYGSTRIDGGLTVYNGANINGGQLVSGGQRVFNRLSLATSALYTQNGATAIDLDCSLANVFVITINSSTGFTLTASGFLEGQMVYVLYNNTGAFTPSITMGTGIRGYYNAGSEQALVISANLGATQQFMAMTAGVSTNLCELSRLIIASS